MLARARPVYRVIFLLVLAPVGAAVTVAALLLFGVDPHVVFFVGFAVKSGLNRMGLHAPNSVGVLELPRFGGQVSSWVKRPGLARARTARANCSRWLNAGGGCCTSLR